VEEGKAELTVNSTPVLHMSPCDLTQEPYGHCGNALGDYLRSVGHGEWKMRPEVSNSGGGGVTPQDATFWNSSCRIIFMAKPTISFPQ